MRLGAHSTQHSAVPCSRWALVVLGSRAKRKSNIASVDCFGVCRYSSTAASTSRAHGRFERFFTSPRPRRRSLRDRRWTRFSGSVRQRRFTSLLAAIAARVVGSGVVAEAIGDGFDNRGPIAAARAHASASLHDVTDGDDVVAIRPAHPECLRRWPSARASAWRSALRSGPKWPTCCSR